MKNSLNFTMIYSILLLGLLAVTNYRGSQAENSLLQYWEEHINCSKPPYQLVAKASPLSILQEIIFIKLIEKNELASHMHTFCEHANIVCSTNSLFLRKANGTTLPLVSQWNGVKEVYDRLPNEALHLIVNQREFLFFRESMVKEGRFMLVPDLRDPVSYKSFLPRTIASKIPFSFAQIEDLKNIFGVTNESNMDKYIQKTLKICKKEPHIRDEQSTCATSAEDLIDFVVYKIGNHVGAWSTENIEGSNENVTIGSVKLIYENLSEPPILCHSEPFPFQVYYCHVLQKVKVYEAELHVQKKVNHAVMVCHYDTSTWDPNHIAFKLLGCGPGLIEICHWMNENGVVWTKII